MTGLLNHFQLSAIDGFVPCSAVHTAVEWQSSNAKCCSLHVSCCFGLLKLALSPDPQHCQDSPLLIALHLRSTICPRLRHTFRMRCHVPDM